MVPTVPLNVGYARPGQPYATATTLSELISDAEWKSHFHRIAVQRRRSTGLHSARGRPDFLHPGKARSVRSLLCDAIDHLWRRMAAVQRGLANCVFYFWKHSGNRRHSRIFLVHFVRLSTYSVPHYLDCCDGKSIHRRALGHSLRRSNCTQTDRRHLTCSRAFLGIPNAFGTGTAALQFRHRPSNLTTTSVKISS